MFSAARIVAIRKSRGFSQEVLAEQAGVSLRTVQRVEQGETVPRGHTLLALATALQVPLEQLQDATIPASEAAQLPTPAPTRDQPEPRAAMAETEPAALLELAQPTSPAHLPAVQASPDLVAAPAALLSTPALRSDPEFLQLLNLSALSFLVMPLLNVVVPLVLWRRGRHTVAHAAEVGRRVLGFQVLWQVGCFFAYGLLAAGQMVAVQYGHAPLKGGFLWVLLLTYLLNVCTVAYYARRLRQGRLDIYPVRL